MQHYHLPAKLRRPSTPGVALRASFPLPPSCDKRHRECAEPTFTTAGTSKSSLLNPVSNGYQHRASNVIRPAAAATSLRGGIRARACARSPCSRCDPRGEAQASGRRATFSLEPSREHDSLVVRVIGRCPEMRTVICHSRRQGTLEAREEQACPAGLPQSPSRPPAAATRAFVGWDGENTH